MTPTSIRPAADEYAPYYSGYVSKVPEGQLHTLLADQLSAVLSFIKKIPEARGAHRYAPGKWSIKDVIQHVIDGERIFTYRALRIARGDATPLASFEENSYAAAANADARSLADLAAEFEHVRRASVALFANFDEAVLSRRGVASTFEVSVRALGYIVVGHAAHHVAILRERYL